MRSKIENHKHCVCGAVESAVHHAVLCSAHRSMVCQEEATDVKWLISIPSLGPLFICLSCIRRAFDRRGVV